MRVSRMGKRICVHGVPLDTTWFCPYCCATVDTAFVTPTGQISVVLLEELNGRVKCCQHVIAACSSDNLP
jgi:hypothetical protein